MNTNNDPLIRHKHYTMRRNAWKTAQYVLLIVIAVLFLIPIFWLVLSSLKTQTEMVTFPPKFLPQIPQFQNYVFALTKIDYLRYLSNTIVLNVR